MQAAVESGDRAHSNSFVPYGNCRIRRITKVISINSKKLRDFHSNPLSGGHAVSWMHTKTVDRDICTTATHSERSIPASCVGLSLAKLF